MRNAKGVVLRLRTQWRFHKESVCCRRIEAFNKLYVEESGDVGYKKFLRALRKTSWLPK